MNAHHDHVRALTATFLDAHGKRIVEELAEGLRQAGSDALLPRALFNLTAAYVREPSGRRLIRAIRKALDKASAPNDPQSLISGQIVLWSVLHRMLRDTDGPHGHPEIIHAVLALAGDTVDSIIGALLDVARSEGAPSPPPGWGTLVELGRTHREFQTLHQIVQSLLNAQDPPRMFEIMEQGILGAFHIRSLAIVAVNHEQGFIEFARAYPAASANLNFIGQRCDLSHPDILCDVARTGRIEVIDGWDPRYHEWIPQADGSITLRQHPRTFNAGRTAFFIPILARGRTVGLVCTASAQSSKQIVLREIERMRPFLDQVGVTLSVVSENIERRKAEEALREAERVRVLVETAGAAAHEINQPLTVVLGLTQLMLLDQALDAAHRRDIEAIHKAGQQIREIVRKMIDLRQYVTKPYIKDIRIVDFDAASRKD